jgi:hypothetical protein
VPLDQPRGVAVDEAADGWGQLVDGAVQLSPHALLPEGGILLSRSRWFPTPQERGIIGDAQPGDRAEEVAPAVSQAQS